MSRDLLIGSEIAGFRVESLIGRGGMGSVYVAEQLGLGRKVALKVLPPELSASESFRRRFERESRLAASLDHPHVIPIFGSGEADGVLYIAMRLVDGADLATLLASSGPLPPRRAANIVAQVGGALDASHRKGLVHRDVKPGNVLIATSEVDDEGDDEDYAYLSDFGLTRMASSDSALTRTGQFMGTVAYAAPEQFEGKPADAKSDLYSLGCVAFECLTGEPPFPREQEAAVMFAHLQQPPPRVTDRLPGAPPALDDVLARAMAKSPDERFGSGREFAAALHSAVAPDTASRAVPSQTPAGPGREIAPGAERTGAPAGGPRGRRALIAALVALAVVGATVGAVIGLSSGGHPVASGGPGGSASASGGPSGVGTQTPGPPPGVPIAVDTVARLDPFTGRVTADYTVGAKPEGIVFSGGAVWVVNQDDHTFSRIDPRLPPSNPSAVATRGAGVPSPCVIAPAADGGIWLSDCDHGLVSHISPNTLSVDRGPYPVPTPEGMVEYHGSLWVVSGSDGVRPDRVVRIAPGNGRRIASVPVGHGAGDITVALGALWGGAFDDGEIWRLDPATMGVTHFGGWTGPRVLAPAPPRDIWVVDEPAGTTSLYDPANGHVEGLIHEGGVGTLLTIGQAVWTLDPGNEALLKTDANTDATLLRFVLPYADFMAFGAGSLWIGAEAD